MEGDAQYIQAIKKALKTERARDYFDTSRAKAQTAFVEIARREGLDAAVQAVESAAADRGDQDCS